MRDYPHPMVAVEDSTISGQIVFAEQEAQERGTCLHTHLGGLGEGSLVEKNCCLESFSLHCY